MRAHLIRSVLTPSFTEPPVSCARFSVRAVVVSRGCSSAHPIVVHADGEHRLHVASFLVCCLCMACDVTALHRSSLTHPRRQKGQVLEHLTSSGSIKADDSADDLSLHPLLAPPDSRPKRNKLRRYNERNGTIQSWSAKMNGRKFFDFGFGNATGYYDIIERPLPDHERDGSISDSELVTTVLFILFRPRFFFFFFSRLHSSASSGRATTSARQDQITPCPWVHGFVLVGGCAARAGLPTACRGGLGELADMYLVHAVLGYVPYLCCCAHVATLTEEMFAGRSWNGCHPAHYRLLFLRGWLFALPTREGSRRRAARTLP